MAVQPGDIFRLNAVGRCFQQRIMLTHGYVVSAVTGTVPSTQAPSALTKAVRAGALGGDVLESKYLECMPSSYTLEYWQAQQIRPFRLAYFRETRNVVGENANTEATNQSAVITLKSEFAGRWAQASKHIGPLPQGPDVQADGFITAGYKTALEIFGGAMLTDVIQDGITFSPVIIHPVGTHGGVTPLISQAIQTTIRVMRRRTVQLGE